LLLGRETEENGMKDEDNMTEEKNEMSGERGNELRRVYPFVGGHGISFLHCPPSE
jgi:hypothetical protein